MGGMKTALLLLASGLALSPIGNAQQPVAVTVVPVEAVGKFMAWLGDPIDPARAASAARYPDRVDRLPYGKKTLLPIVVSGLPVPAPREMRFVADVEILGNDERSLAASPRCCRGTLEEGSLAGAVMLERWVLVEPEGRGSGRYTVRVSVTDGRQSWTTSATLPYGDAGADLPGSANEAPRLRMNVPPAQLEGGGPGDKRDCLALPTPSEVIRCAERK